MSIFRLSPIECTRQQHPYILRLYGTESPLSFLPFRLNGQILNFQFSRLSPSTRFNLLYSVVRVGCRLLFSHLQARHARSAILVAVAPLSVLESDAKLILFF